MPSKTVAVGDPNKPVEVEESSENESLTTETEETKLFNFQQIRGRLEKMITSFDQTVRKTVNCNRGLRFIDIDMDPARMKADLEKNDVMILIRVIDQNIRREQPAYVQYLKQPERLAGFTDILNPTSNTRDLENEYTRGVTYINWDIPYIKCVDAAQTHGWCNVEVVYDESKPFQVSREFIDTEDLIFDLKTKDIQSQEIILRGFNVVPRVLESWVAKFGFDKVEVDKLLKELTDSDKEKPIRIYKKFCKYDDIVYVSWFSIKCQDWLKKPEPLFIGTYEEQTTPTQVPSPVMGIDGLPMTDEIGEPVMNITTVPITTLENKPVSQYPIFTFIYEITENCHIVENKGRVFKDKHKQEAMIANLSAFVSGCLRAADVIVSPKNKTEGGLKTETVNMSHGTYIKEPVDYFNAPYPNSQMLQLAEYLEAFNAEDAGRPSYAIQKKSSGSRITAEQVKSARQDQVQLNALQVSSFSTFVREVENFMWTIVQNRAMFDKITFLSDPATGVNNKEIIGRDYDIRAAGDTDVIKKNELLELYQQYFPIVANTPAALVYTEQMLALAFGREAQKWLPMISANDPIAILAQLLAILKVTLDPEEIPRDPQSQQQLMMLIQQAEQVVASAAQTRPGGGSQGQQSSPNTNGQNQPNNNLQLNERNPEPQTQAA